MFSQLIWWACIAVEALLLLRGLRGKLALRYPLFYSYVGFVFLQDLIRFGVHQWYPALYSYVYWSTAIISILVGCGLVFEIYRIGLMQYPGTAKMARNILAVVFASAVIKVGAGAWNDPRGLLEASYVDLELTLRVVEALSIAGLVLLFLIYSIPFGRNLRGIVLGYGLFVGSSIISLTFLSFDSAGVGTIWSQVYRLSYVLVLIIWTVHLWSYKASPEPRRVVNLEHEYQRMSSGTRRRLHEARGYLGKAAGQ